MKKRLMMGSALWAAAMAMAGCGAGVAGDAGMQLNGEATFHTSEPGVAPVAQFAIAGYGPDTQALASLSGAAATYHVAPDGADSAPGTAAAPFQTLQRAAQAATQPATIVLVAPGHYAGGVQAAANGASITWVSTTRWGARLLPDAGSAGTAGTANRGDRVGLIGFAVADRY